MLCQQAAGVKRRRKHWMAMERSLFRNWSEQQTWLPEERTMGACCRSGPCPGRPGGQAMPGWPATASRQVSASAQTAGPGPVLATTARPAASVPWLASAGLSPVAVDWESSCRPYQREISQRCSACSHLCVECLVCSTGRPASMTTNEDNAPAD